MLEKLFSSQIRYKILNYFLKNENKEVYPAYLKNILDEDAGNILRELKKLTKWDILIQKKKGQKNFYSLNKESDYIPYLIKLFSLERAVGAKETWFLFEDVPDGFNPNMTVSYLNSALTEKFFKSIGIKNTPKKYLHQLSKGKCKIFFVKKYYQACRKEVLEKIFKNPEKGLTINQDLKKRSDQFFDFAEKTRKIELSQLSDKELVGLLEEFYSFQAKMHRVGWIGNIADVVDNTFSNYLINYLEERINKTKSKLKKGKIFSILTTPLEESYSQKEYFSYLNILKEIKKIKKSVRFLSSMMLALSLINCLQNSKK